jgi:hypothetical protein
MGNVYIEARPKGRHEGTAIEDYVIEITKTMFSRPSRPRRKRSIGRKQRAIIPSSPA